ncbi:MAG: primosomal protein N' [Desulfobacteraceae bacterium]|nr:primosomal protein N' [Desulfobacteraceae bacterium]
MRDKNRRLIDVVLPLPIERGLTYALSPAAATPPRGGRVLVQVGPRNMIGIAWGSTHLHPSCEIKEVIKVIDETPFISETLLKFFTWMSSYYFYPIGKVIEEALPPGFLSSRSKRIAKIAGSRSGCSRSPEFSAWKDDVEIELNGEQVAALEYIEAVISRRSYSPVLLHGVTGSGKTEVYLRAAQRCLAQGRGVLFMVPEIAMTTQTVGRFVSRFGGDVAVLHSGLTEWERRDQWLRIKGGKGRIVIGTRSAIFAPMDNLGLAVVDEEHDTSYKQEDRFRYNARDLAVLRASMSGAVVILGSATPSIASYNKALAGRYHLITMKKRVKDRPMPEVAIIDRRKKTVKAGSDRPDKKNPGWLTDELKEAIGETIGRGEQVLLFLNRRGFATFVFCPDCGYVFKCPRCDVSLTWHRAVAASDKTGPAAACGRGSMPDGSLVCHYCGSLSPAMPLCPNCGGHAVKASGYGTERLISDLAGLFPGARLARLDRDMIRRRKDAEGVLMDFQEGRIDVLVGTQMVTKGHDFPRLTLVGMIWADLSLNFPDYQAAEHTFQLIAQVAGRAGRGARPGRVLIQTLMPDHYALECAASHDYQRFYEKEVILRKKMCYPPFSRLINFRFSGKNKEIMEKTVSSLADVARKIIPAHLGLKADIFGPSPAPRAKIKDKLRWQMLLRSERMSDLRVLCAELLLKSDGLVPRGVTVEVDVDPVNLL